MINDSNLETERSRNIEKLISEGKLAEAQKSFFDFLRQCGMEIENLVLIQSRLSILDKNKILSVITDTDADMESNRIALSFLSQIDLFRKKVLSKYFDIRGEEAFFESFTSRDEILSRMLDLRLRPKRYILEKQLEEGNSSLIFRLQHPDTRRLAIAMLLKMPSLSADIKLEIDRLTDLRHRNIIKLLDHELEIFPFFIITEYVSGVKLPDAIARTGPRPISQAADWLYQLTEALEYLRHKRILHTNVRPSKIYIDDEWQVMISPFDMYKISSGGEHTFKRYLDVCQYGSPELLKNDGIGLTLQEMCISDEYSLGLIGYKILTGNDLFSGNSVLDILKSREKFVVDKKYRIEKLAALPKNKLTTILSRMLEENPGNRFKSLHEVLRMLHSMTRIDQNNESIVRKSYRRCLATNKAFIREFYHDFQNKLDAKNTHFTPTGIMRQTSMLQMAIDVLIDIDDKKEYLERIVSSDKHSKFGLKEYEVFLSVLLNTVKGNDPLWNEYQEIATEWNMVIEKSLQVIKEKLDKTVLE